MVRTRADLHQLIQGVGPASISFFVPGDPVAWQRVVPRGRGGGGRSFPFVPRQVREAKERVAWCFKAAGGLLREGAVHIALEFALDPARRARGPEYDPRDLDNLEKLVLDALQMVAYPNDRRVVSCTKRKVIRAPAGTLVTLEWSAPAGPRR